jgi:hypothetical protein
MEILLFRLGAKATIACIAAAIAFSAAPRAAEAQVTELGYGSTFTSDPNETLTYAPSIGNVELETSVYSGAGLGLGEGEPDLGTLNGAPGSLSLGFSATAFFDADEGVPATPVGDGYDGQNLPFDGVGNFEFNSASGTVSGNLGGGEVFAKPGASSAVIELEVANEIGATVGYLVLSGSTPSPVSLTTTTPFCFAGMTGACPTPYFNQITLDFTATYQATPYVPTSGTSAIPEPSTWVLMLLGFIGLGFTGSRASRRRGALAGPASLFVDRAHLRQSSRGSGRTLAYWIA